MLDAGSWTLDTVHVIRVLQAVRVHADINVRMKFSSGQVIRIPLDIADNVAERAVHIRAKEALVFAYFQSKEFKASEFEAKAGDISKAYDAAHPESF